ncbi:MAG: DUF3868 domain-containing protein [Paraprevotella sp.]|nr:DUF3868 domain-containing protein [Paraprevotella sp.]
MKRMTLIWTALLGLAPLTEAGAQETKQHITPGVSVDHMRMERNGKYLTVEMEVDLTELNVDINRATLLTPRLVNGKDSVDLPSIGIYGRRRYYYYVRNGISSISGKDETVCRASRKPDRMDYNRSVAYEDWMDGATLKFHHSDWGCCQDILAEYEGRLGRHDEAFFPELVFIRPKVEAMKTRSLSGSAFIDFCTDKTEIDPKYRNNTAELGKIKATIDSVRQDKDITIQSIWLKGYASPESPYAHNTDLAKRRTQALKEHIRWMIDLDERIITTAYEPEDWEGLRKYVENSNLEHRTEILQIIDSPLQPDPKEDKIRRTYPKEYSFLKEFCYPALRHTDYRIEYTIRSYSNVEEIKRVLTERPQNLSPNEFYLVAGEYEPGSAEFTEVFETAVRMFPNDTIANLNAANAAMRHGDNKTARKYLQKAGHSAEAVYAQGSLAIREKDYKAAVAFLKEASKMGLKKADETLEELIKRGYTEE